MEVWFCKGGESIAEKNLFIQGHQDGELTETGFIQSKLLGNRLRYVQFIEIISSDLNRVKQTTKEILSFRDIKDCHFDSRLREKSAGIFEGKSLIEYRKEAIKNGVGLREFRPQGGENWIDTFERCNTVLNDLIVKYVKKDFTDKTNLIGQESIPKLKKMGTITPTLQVNMLQRSKTQVIGSKKNIELKKMPSMDIDLSESDYLKTNINNLLTNDDYNKRISKIYRGFDPSSIFNRVLLITHGGFIMEFLNCIRMKRDIPIKFINNSKASALYVLKIYCVNCGTVCYSKDEKCSLNFDLVIFNDVDHLKIN